MILTCQKKEKVVFITQYIYSHNVKIKNFININQLLDILRTMYILKQRILLN